MDKRIDELVGRYRNQGVFVDANLLILCFVGAYDRYQIPKFKRTRAYTIEDYDTLVRFLACFEKRITTPNVLTEVSNLTARLPRPVHEAFASNVLGMDEYYVESLSIVEHKHFDHFGLTDLGIVALVKNKYLVLTDDLELASYMDGVGVDVINFNRIRVWYWKIP
jgi:hypothetical protein